jgi:TraM recognition site of TraD and TraG/Type IV secretion-system coupling protein DNA-binding domain
MTRSDSLAEPEAGPLAPLGEALHWLLAMGAHVALGLAIGLMAARLMRRAGLHWSWAIAGLLAGWLLHAVARVSATVADLGALTAAVLGRRWHRQDRDAGRDLSELAAARRSPLELLRSLGHALAVRRRMRVGAGWFRGDQLIVGRDEQGALLAIPLGGRSGGTHTLVLGATGSGKTMTQRWIAVQAIGRGMGAIVVDPKGDRGLREALRDAACLSAKEFIEWSPSGPSVYNPYARGSDTEIADKALAGERFTEPHYLRQAQRYLGHVVRALRLAGLEVSLPRLVEQLDPAALERILRALPETHARPSHAYLDSLTQRQRTDLAGVRDRLAILAESDLGRWLDPERACAAPFDLLQALGAGAVVYFDLESDSRPLLAQMLGAAIVQDLQTTVAALQARPLPALVLIDEFSAVSAEHVVRLFGRARSAGVSLVLGTQELADLRLPARGHVLEQVMGNLSVLIAHRQVLPESCALVASLAGTRGAWRTSRHSDGRTTRTRTAEGVLAAERLMRLRPGWAAVMVLTGSADARIGRVFASARR